MTEYAARALLPEGLHDELPPAAEHEAAVVSRLVAVFAAHGYQRVKPPLIEFEESLTAGPGAAQGTGMFRLVDPASQRLMAVRSDMTVQVARIAATRLQKAARPLRLSYAGQVLRVKGTQLRPERQFPQAGVELIGVRSVAADAEVVLLAVEALEACGHARPVTVDLTLPTLVPAIAAALALPAALADKARDALDGKDAAELDGIPGEAGILFRGLLAAAGPADRALDTLAGLALPPAARREVQELAGLVAAIRKADPAIALTIDPGEYRAHEYHTGFGFTLFAAGVRGELGRGGRYDLVGPDGGTEEAVGFTLYVDSLLRSLPKPALPVFVYLPFDTPAAEARALRAAGHRTVAGLAPVDDAAAEARRLGCSHLYHAGAVTPVAA
ncbi:ATP phosphoribosyltransferase regulatory subunit [Zavarzinia compransoris]|uniref:ATP phosphoribosyltransferase regulatory subunit n=1 Tax=Zavarzinia compransoris TaxID=1264899 RepID=A0A317E3A6_9PROT|nr:ATP phosphoribosyltransferase regulatory subunit [Zavarzinia compransoris]PWR20626.1 ATP phosphoribosyltransferase regulatory subunit [Zavarzinia compransoris]TDP44557.1 ATP phosphoribosyltransferase regulatory subunit [Zavarzinia compransoris]